MKVQCPKHQTMLTLEKTTLELMNVTFPVVVGRCPKCDVVYINKEILPSCEYIIINGKKYTYSESFALSCPPDEKAASIRLTPNQQKTARQLQLRQIKAMKKSEQRTQRKQIPNEQAFQEKRRRIEEDTYGQYHPKNICYCQTLPENCPNDSEPLIYVERVVLQIDGNNIKDKGLCCVRCNSIYFLEREKERIELLSKAMTKIRIDNEKQKTNTPKEKKITEKVEITPTFTTHSNTLYICKGLIACHKKKHIVESSTGLLWGKNDTVIRLNTNYCPQCKKHFIAYDEYLHYRKLHGVLLGNFKITNGSFDSPDYDMAEESPLHLCGYSVNQTENLTTNERHEILRYLIDSKILSKPDIISYLNFFIRRNGKRENMQEAVRRWNQDVEWVRDYQINRQRHYEISNIQKNK